ncbi:MAG: HAD family hydrolase [Elusimicrobiota bacterium]
MPEPRRLRAVVLDFDGVVLESVDVKTRAFAALFREEGPEVVARVVAHHEANGGISRFEKFRWVYREVLSRPLSESQEKALGDRFNALVEEAVAAAAWVPGAQEFISAWRERLPLFVASGTPQEELRRVVERRGLTSSFRGVYGSPRGKAEILRSVAAELGCAPGELVMVGDSINDWEGARAAGTLFVGRRGGSDPFPSGTPVIADLRGLDAALRGL